MATLSCARDNQLSHATPRLGPREFRGKEMNELASSLTRERRVDVFEERSDCEWKEEEKRLIGEFIINVNCITIYLLLLELIFILIAIVIDPIL